MTVTITDAAQAIKYLHAAGAMTVVDDMEAVWADYINDPTVGVPDVAASDLLPAARDCLKTWAAQNRAWRVDLPRYMEAIKRVRHQRWTAYKHAHGEPYPTDHAVTNDPRLFLTWQHAAKTAVLAGATDSADVERAAYAAINRPVPVIEPTNNHEIKIRDLVGAWHPDAKGNQASTQWVKDQHR